MALTLLSMVKKIQEVEITKEQIENFREMVWDHYRVHGRSLPWRTPNDDGGFDPYKILVSEIMLQQTQVSRVITKYQIFLDAFPSVGLLAEAPLGDVLRLWNGLGYNRRAKYLHEAARTINTALHGNFPSTADTLSALPGVGKNTAGAIMAYAYDAPAVFIETNIRTVFIHHFYGNGDIVTDRELLSSVRAVLPPENIRQWYWALMDYGTFIKSEVGNASRQSTHHKNQSTFHGSRRQLRGRVIRLLSDAPHSLDSLQKIIADERLDAVLLDLSSEGLVSCGADGAYSLPT